MLNLGISIYIKKFGYVFNNFKTRILEKYKNSSDSEINNILEIFVTSFLFLNILTPHINYIIFVYFYQHNLL